MAYCRMLSVFFFFLFLFFADSVSCGKRSIMATVSYPHVELIQNQWLITVFEGQRHTTYETISPASLPTQVITHSRLLRGGWEGALPVSSKTVWCKTMGPVSLGMPMVGGFSFLSHDWDDLNPSIYVKGHFCQKAVSACYIFEVQQGQNPDYKRFYIHTCVFYFTGWFKKSNIKTRNTA